MRKADSRARAKTLYACITAAERELSGHMDEWNVDHVPVAVLVSVEPALTAVLANLNAAIHCLEAVRAASRHVAERGAA